MKTIILLASTVFLSGPFALAATGMESATQPSTTPTPSSIRDTSNDTKNSAQMGQLVNIATGAANMALSAEEMSQCPAHQYKCAMSIAHFIMGVANFAQSKAHGTTASQATSSLNATDTGSQTLNPSGGAGYDPQAALNDPAVKNANNFIKDMTGTTVAPGKPFAYDPKTNTVITASGKTLKVNDVSSPGGMAAAGISKDVIDSAMASQKEILAEAMKKVEGYKTAAGAGSSEESASGGGGWGASGGAGGGGADGHGVGGLNAGGSAAGLGIDRDPAQLAGMQKNYNGEAIGVAGDSIFGMMTRRYKVKESQRSFYDESELLVHK